MHPPLPPAIPAGTLRRVLPAGASAGAPLSRIAGADEALALVADDLVAAERELHGLVHSEVAAVGVIAGYLAEAGGKRIRPALTALGVRAVGYDRSMPRLMCVGELIHLGSLLHDDVVDEAETRRGRPAAHTVFGNGVSVLTGDFCLARAVLLAAEEGGHLAVTALARAVTDMAEGEVLQLQRSNDFSCDRDGYVEVIDKKSAALIAWCTAAGALVAQDEDAAAALDRFGRQVGLAFQITDDVLDYAPGTGKVPGVDLRQRKVTLPVIFAMERVPEVRSILEAGPPSDAQVSWLLDRIADCGALARARSEAFELVSGAVTGIESLPAGPGRDALVALGRHLVERVH